MAWSLSSCMNYVQGNLTTHTNANRKLNSPADLCETYTTRRGKAAKTSEDLAEKVQMDITKILKLNLQ